MKSVIISTYDRLGVLIQGDIHAQARYGSSVVTITNTPVELHLYMSKGSSVLDDDTAGGNNQPKVSKHTSNPTGCQSVY